MKTLTTNVCHVQMYSIHPLSQYFVERPLAVFPTLLGVPAWALQYSNIWNIPPGNIVSYLPSYPEANGGQQFTGHTVNLWCDVGFGWAIAKYRLYCF